MLQDHIRWSNETNKDREYLIRINDLYKRGLEMVEGKTFRGREVNLNNMKEVIAVLYLLAKEYESFHEG